MVTVMAVGTSSLIVCRSTGLITGGALTLPTMFTVLFAGVLSKLFAVTRTCKSAELTISVTTTGVLSEVSKSGPLAYARILLVANPGVIAFTVMLTVTASNSTTGPKKQLTTPFVTPQLPLLGVTDTKLTLGGSVS